MTQKHHQEEISGPIDAIEAAPLAKDCPRPKRARIQSRKAQENQAQNQLSEVLSFRSATPAVPTPTPSEQVSSEYLQSTGNDVSQPKRRRPLIRQNSSQEPDINIQDRKEKKEWQIQVESTQNKSKKLQILIE